MFDHLNLYPAQVEFITKAHSIIQNDKIGIFSSPTGTGKTLSLLCSISQFIKEPSALCTGLNKENSLLMEELFGTSTKKCNIFYCSRTHIQLNQAINELKRVCPTAKAVIVGSRKLYCLNESINNTPDGNLLTEKCNDLVMDDKCEYYNKMYIQGMEKRNNNNSILNIEEINKDCKSNGFCSYYFSKEYAQDCDIIFLPYTLLFSKEGRQSLNIELNGSIVVVDEAHNIYETVIQMNTISVNIDIIKKYFEAFSKYKIKYEKRMLKNNLEKIKKVLSILENLIVFLRNAEYKNLSNSQNETFFGFYKVSEFLIKSGLDEFNMLEIEDYIRDNKITEKLEGFNTNLHHQLYSIIRFLKLLIFSDEHGRVFYNRNRIQFTPIDPKIYFEEINCCRSLILAGGTMEPIDHLKRMFDEREMEYYSYPSICNNFTSHILTTGPTKCDIKLNYENKENVEIINEILRCIYNLSNLVKNGGTICFIPSKNYIQIIKKNLENHNFKKKILFDDDCNFEEYKKYVKKEDVILFSVMGGKMSEGINFNDELCRLLLVIGIPYPTYNIELKEKIKYYGDEFPRQIAMKTVNQALGRALRHKKDFSAIILLDIRFLKLRNYLSPWIRDKIKTQNFPSTLLDIAQFYRNIHN
ncbi:ATP-dependent DNA helicase chl1 [Conglomerata obtusa]